MPISISRVNTLGERPALFVLLPERSRFASASLPKMLASALGRSQRWLEPLGEIAQLQRHFSVKPLPWSVAALTRQYDAGDAENALWLRADPVNMQPDQYSARLMAYGQSLSINDEDTAALLPDLQALFAQEGWILEAPTPSRWYLRLPEALPLPEFASPEQVLGADLFAHLPSGEHGRRWCALLNECQVLLHQHRHNLWRLAQGKPAINSLWFWGAGCLPETVSSRYQQVRSPDPLLQALARQAGITPDQDTSGRHACLRTLVDLRHINGFQILIDQALTPLLVALKGGELAAVHLDFADGAQFYLQPNQRWKFWAKPVLQLTC